jgi:phosphoglycerol geranylgeranyltransferase
LSELGPIETQLRKEVKAKGTLVAALIDPEEFKPEEAAKVAATVQTEHGSLILIGGSTLAGQDQLDDVVCHIKKAVTLPVILFPGNITGVSRHADAILFMSLLNSTNPYFIVGAQALGSVLVRRYNLEAIPMGYLVIGRGSSTSFVADVKEIPPDKPSIAAMYSLAAQYMGMRAIYLEAGSGSQTTVQTRMIQAVRKYFEGLLIVGGGITTPDVARQMAKAGADVLVIGNLLQRPTFTNDFRRIVKIVSNVT